MIFVVIEVEREIVMTMSLINMFPSVINVLELVCDDGLSDQRGVARGLLFLIQ